MQIEISRDPVIPDHEVIRKIGGGSYGEVWLARGVTGALRAVKVVRRTNFEDERGFEREFEGILKYEPVSRDHAGLVNILHVGRSDEEGGFYYYVMELGDDIRTGNKINTVEYEPRNLWTDMQNSEGALLDVDFVIEVGRSLAEALAYLHEKGLSHRDIKPSNIIFVEGKAQLADIGLVATHGQRTFVGTEGFIPPEGPGSEQADVYGLGKVLYEMATGKDRLDFPELPDDLPDTVNLKRWLSLNQLICDICETRELKRRIKTSAALAESLRRLQEGKKIQYGTKGLFLKVMIVIAMVMALGFILKGYLTSLKEPNNSVKSSAIKELKYGFVKVVSDPEGAEVYDQDGNFLDITPFQKKRLPAGERYWFEFRLDGYRTEHEEVVVEEGLTKIVEHVMSIYTPPVAGQEWVDNMGVRYQPMDGFHISSGFIRAHQWNKFERENKKVKNKQVIEHSESGVRRRIVLVSPEWAAEYCRWQTQKASEEGYLNDEQYIIPQLDLTFTPQNTSKEPLRKGVGPFHAVVKNIPFAYLEIITRPEGAICLIDGEYQGVSPCSNVRLKPGKVELTVSLEGYRRASRVISLEEGGDQRVSIKLKKDNSVVFGKKWENSLGMNFVPVSDDLLVSAWETRVKDYLVYTQETGVKEPESPGFRQSLKDPVLQVSRDDAEAFCRWLTKNERAQERISADDEYRLLTDLEWSLLCGLKENPEELPTAREFRSGNIFPWGQVWPPEEVSFKVGNLADRTAAQAADVRRDRTLLNYDDGFKKTSPVGSFPPNDLGIYDLAGNAHEWVQDNYNEAGDFGVLRGGGWNSYQKEHLTVTQRNAVRPSKVSNLYGFRIALAKVTPSNPLGVDQDKTPPITK